MSLKFLTRLDGLAPFLIFPALSFAAVKLLFGQILYLSGLEEKLNEICDESISPDPHPLRLEYTGLLDVDRLLCGVVTFFHALMDPVYRPLIAEVATFLAAVSIIPFVEAAREKRSFFLRMPAAVGILFQIMSLAVIMPIYSLVFIVTGAAGRTARSSDGARINQANAEALLFAFSVGYVIPTVCMILFEDPIVTAIWQIFPLMMEVAQFAHRVIRPPSRYIESGYRTVQATFIFIFVASAVIHAVYVWPLLRDVQALEKMFVPSLHGPATSSLVGGVVAFIKWDMIIGGGSTVLSTLWMANSVTHLISIILWHSTATVLLGPGAAIAGVLLWREAQLNGGNHAVKVERKFV
ncbi:hypothetical protein F5I97DRAFT_2071981 [Phlebopus sp. FC_14]|nr:hypothetical protein F5I97DRAFT_2071981 [Phlebopus sp. FC_14]